jgi:hypothetical protein
MKNIVNIVAVAALLFIGNVYYQEHYKNHEPVSPVAPATYVSPQLQSMFTPIKMIVDRAGPDAKAQFAQAWSDYLTVLRSNSAKFDTIGKLRNAHDAFGNTPAFAQLGLAGAFPGFTAACNDAFKMQFGEDDAKLDFRKAEEFYTGLVWACGS